MISFDEVTVNYENTSGERATPALQKATFTIPEGDICLVVGKTGVGKSTLLRCINGLVPHFVGATMEGHVLVAGRDTRSFMPRDFADLVGLVGQDPLASFVTDRVEEEIAYVMESLGVPSTRMRQRVEEMLDLCGLAEVRDRPLSTLSAGQQQRVAIGAALAANPKVLVLDEPTSALDPAAAEDVLSALHRLAHDVAITVVLAEHRLERVAQYADHVLLIPERGEQPRLGTPGEMLAASPVAPPVVRMAPIAGWKSTPVSIRDARRMVSPAQASRVASWVPSRPDESLPHEKLLLSVKDLSVQYGHRRALEDVALEVNAGERIALMGRNGAGKSSFLWAIQGSGARTSGLVTVEGTDPDTLAASERHKLVGLVPAHPSDVLYRETVLAECQAADAAAGCSEGTSADYLRRFIGTINLRNHPLDLSEGQRLSLVLALMLTSSPALLLFDEPTRGLDYLAKEEFVDILETLSREKQAIITATHDVEFVAEYATRVVMLAEGNVVSEGKPADVIGGSALFAPQVSKVFSTTSFLTLREFAQFCEASHE